MNQNAVIKIAAFAQRHRIRPLSKELELSAAAGAFTTISELVSRLIVICGWRCGRNRKPSLLTAQALQPVVVIGIKQNLPSLYWWFLLVSLP
jgi:hypothetical protein